eukprot:3578454-Prymnesium_polylepis.2
MERRGAHSAARTSCGEWTCRQPQVGILSAESSHLGHAALKEAGRHREQHEKVDFQVPHSSQIRQGRRF